MSRMDTHFLSAVSFFGFYFCLKSLTCLTFSATQATRTTSPGKLGLGTGHAQRTDPVSREALEFGGKGKRCFIVAMVKGRFSSAFLAHLSPFITTAHIAEMATHMSQPLRLQGSLADALSEARAALSDS